MSDDPRIADETLEDKVAASPTTPVTVSGDTLGAAVGSTVDSGSSIVNSGSTATNSAPSTAGSSTPALSSVAADAGGSASASTSDAYAGTGGSRSSSSSSSTSSISSGSSGSTASLSAPTITTATTATSAGPATMAAGSSTTGTGSTGSTAANATDPAAGSDIDEQCHLDEHNEYHGDVVLWGDKNMKESAGECCQSCAATPGCNIWVFCGREEGCGHGTPKRAKGECWLKHNSVSYILSNYRQGHSGISWTAGALYNAAEYEQYVKEHEAAVRAEAARLRKLRDDPELPLVWIEVALNGTVLGRIEMVLFVKESPRAAENMRLLCSGEKGTDNRGRPYHLKGSYFYRIIDRFIDQTGALADGIFDGDFHDDPGGLKLKHTHKGLLSMANSGPNTNGGHFSLIMGAAHHLDGSYTIFGEIVSGIEHAEKINALSKGQPNNELLHSTLAQIVDAGQTRPGSYVSTPQFKAVIQAERNRIAWRRAHAAELPRLLKLYQDKSMPLVYLDIAIKGVYAGRIEAVLLMKDSPLAAENFRLLCTGEAGPQFSFKGSHFYRIVRDFVDQAGPQSVISPLGGQFRDDPGGLKINHTHLGQLSMANAGPNTNGASFFILISPAPHLNGGYTVFGEIVDGHNIAAEINALAAATGNKELLGSKDAQIIDAGELRRGTYWDDPAFKTVIAEERRRIEQARGKAAT